MIVLLGGCSKHYTMEELAGRYALAVDNGTDAIELKSDGTYIHSYKARSGSTTQQAGTWVLETQQAGPTVVLKEFRSLVGGDQRASFDFLPVRTSFGHIYLLTNIDLNVGYERQP